MHISLLLERLDGVRKSGASWIAKCPAHEDKSPSLSVTERDGKILLRCHASCPTRDVLEAIGLRFTDLFSDQKRGVPAALTADLNLERSVLMIAKYSTDPLSADDKARVLLAHQRIAAHERIASTFKAGAKPPTVSPSRSLHGSAHRSGDRRESHVLPGERT